MTQIEDIAVLVFRDGMTEQDFFQQMFAELMLRNRAIVRKVSIDEVKKDKGKDGLSDYELWKKGLIRSVFESESLIKHPAEISSILSNSYTYRRHTNFPDYTDFEKKRMDAAMTDTADVHAFEQGGFCFRMLKGWTKTKHSLARFQINADMNPEMIKDLDNFIKRHNSVYKTTPTDKWARRTDTLNVYMYEPVTDDIKKEIVQIMTPYIRRSKPLYVNFIDGELLADGIGFVRTATLEEISTLVTKYPSHLQQSVRNYFSGGVSLGVIRTAEEFLDMYRKYAPRLCNNTPSLNKIQSSDISVSPSKPEEKAPQDLSIQALLQEMRAARLEIQSARSELVRLRQGNAQLEKTIAGLMQENAQLRSGNELLRSQKKFYAKPNESFGPI